MTRTLAKHVARRQDQSLADWCVEIRELAGERWPEFSDQAPTLYAVWGGARASPLHGRIDIAAAEGRSVIRRVNSDLRALGVLPLPPLEDG